MLGECMEGRAASGMIAGGGAGGVARLLIGQGMSICVRWLTGPIVMGTGALRPRHVRRRGRRGRIIRTFGTCPRYG